MRAAEIVRHVLRTVAIVSFVAGIPLLSAVYKNGGLGGLDATSAATTVIDKPEGGYVVLLNKRRHTDEDKLKTWETFFEGKEIGVLFDDLSCMVADGDAFGLEVAGSFQSRLPENQMTVRTENRALLISKVSCGLYDCVLMSQEMYGSVRDGLQETQALKIESDH